jgi:hypothetical protein
LFRSLVEGPVLLKSTASDKKALAEDGFGACNIHADERMAGTLGDAGSEAEFVG